MSAQLTPPASRAATFATSWPERLRAFRRQHPPRWLVTHHHEWRYLAGGPGRETVLLLSGNLGRAEAAFPLVERLERDFRVIAPDQPQVHSLDGMLDGLIRILDMEGVAKVHLVGHSFGGLLAQSLVRRFPGRVESLVLSHTGVPRAARAQVTARWRRVLALVPGVLLRLGLGLAVERQARQDRDPDPFWPRYLREVASSLEKGTVLARLDVGMDLDRHGLFTAQDLATWPGRTLLLEDEDDPAVSHAEKDALKALHPGARVHTFRRRSSLGTMVSSEELVDAVMGFLGEPAVPVLHADAPVAMPAPSTVAPLRLLPGTVTVIPLSAR